MAGSPQNPENGRELLAFRVPRVLADALRQRAHRDGDTTSALIRRLIRAGLEIERRSSDEGGRG